MSYLSIIDKLKNSKSGDLNEWSLQEKKELLELYKIISQKEEQIFDLIYSFHGCDTFEDIFRDYELNYLSDKTEGVKIALKEINNEIKNQNKNDQN